MVTSMSKRPNNKQNLPKKQERQDISNMYIVYTDGSADNMNPMRPAGCAFIILNPFTHEVIDKYSEGFKGLTNNQAELNSIVSAIDALPKGANCCIFTDIRYCISVLDHKKQTFEKNMPFIEQFRYLVEEKNISYTFKWVRGHYTDKWNAEVDSMANSAYQYMAEKLKSKEHGNIY